MSDKYAEQLQVGDELQIDVGNGPEYAKVLAATIEKDGNVYTTFVDPSTGNPITLPVPRRNVVTVKDPGGTAQAKAPSGASGGGVWWAAPAPQPRQAQSYRRSQSDPNDPEPNCTCDSKALFSVGCSCAYSAWNKRRKQCS